MDVAKRAVETLRGTVTVVRHEDLRCGFVVDEVVGQHQTVIESLGRMFRNVNGLSGATILGDGRVALIVDLPALIPTASAAA
jgi:two-component system chemotaxis sensor kinase CheA